MVERYRYDAYGNPYEGRFLHTPKNNPYGFTGQRFEPELRMYSFAYREYNPVSMRWMTEDPIKDGLNWYQYCGSDPVNWVDLFGLCKQDDFEDPRGKIVKIDTELGVAINERGEMYSWHPITGGVGVLPLTDEEIRDIKIHSKDLQWPTTGTITNVYGPRIAPDTKGKGSLDHKELISLISKVHLFMQVKWQCKSS